MYVFITISINLCRCVRSQYIFMCQVTYIYLCVRSLNIYLCVKSLNIYLCVKSLIWRILSTSLVEFQLGRDWKTMTLYPFILHSISMSLFASVIGPFGGFFASGFKR